MIEPRETASQLLLHMRQQVEAHTVYDVQTKRVQCYKAPGTESLTLVPVEKKRPTTKQLVAAPLGGPALLHVN